MCLCFCFVWESRKRPIFRGDAALTPNESIAANLFGEVVVEEGRGPKLSAQAFEMMSTLSAKCQECGSQVRALSVES